MITINSHMIFGLMLIGVLLVMHIIQSTMLLIMVLLLRYKQKVKRTLVLSGGTILPVLVTHHRLLVLLTTTSQWMGSLDSHMDSQRLVLVVRDLSLVYSVVLDPYSPQVVLVNVLLLLSLVRIHHLEILVVLVFYHVPSERLDLDLFLDLDLLVKQGLMHTMSPQVSHLQLMTGILYRHMLVRSSLHSTLVRFTHHRQTAKRIGVRFSTLQQQMLPREPTHLMVMQLVDSLEHLIKVLVVYSQQVVQQKLLQWITRQLVSSTSLLHLNLLVTPIASVGSIQEQVISTHSVDVLSLEHGITVIPYQPLRQVQTMV